jgi:hypothetical protein
MEAEDDDVILSLKDDAGYYVGVYPEGYLPVNTTKAVSRCTRLWAFVSLDLKKPYYVYSPHVYSE